MTVHDYSAKTIDGEDRTLSDYKKSGKVVKRYGSMDKPESIIKDIEKLL